MGAFILSTSDNSGAQKFRRKIAKRMVVCSRFLVSGSVGSISGFGRLLISGFWWEQGSSEEIGLLTHFFIMEVIFRVSRNQPQTSNGKPGIVC
jgi:hypothetical protein